MHTKFQASRFNNKKKNRKVAESVEVGVRQVPGTSHDKKMRMIALASSAFGRLRESVWRRGNVSQLLNVRLFRDLIIPIAMYRAETWNVRVEDSIGLKCLK